MSKTKKAADKFELLVELPLRDLHGNIDAVSYRRELTPAQKREVEKAGQMEKYTIY